jgi:hypothetical protein
MKVFDLSKSPPHQQIGKSTLNVPLESSKKCILSAPELLKI